ncbi:MAG TPA: ABC transporter permease, partial [Candidatus Acidoferrales bacterium]|nr:ABC transporter permease [Candidatus Acidoferrales bacterium]
MNNPMQDIRYAIRTLRKNPGFTLVAILTLAFGMAANTTIFSIVNALLLKTLPVPHAEQIVVLSTEQKNNPITRTFSYADFQDYQKHADAFSDLFAYELSLVGLSADGNGSHFVISYVSSNYFSALEIQPALGRLILPTEGQAPGADPVLVLGYTFWRTRFGGDPGVIGKHVLVNGRPLTIVGVAPRGFYGTYSVADCQGFVPMSIAGAISKDSSSLWSDRSDREITVLGRLKPGMGVKQAEASLNVTANQLAQQYPDTNKGIAIHVYPERLARPEPDPQNPLPAAAAIFLALAGLVLLLACFNIANVLLVRATVRQREMAIRAALGAKRGRLIRQFLTESLLLAFFGGVAGALLAVWASGVLGSLRLATDLPLRLDFTPDGGVFLYALAAVVLTGIVVGIVPAIRVARTDVSAVLHEGGRGSSDGPRRHLLRNILVVAQVAGSLVLLVVAGLAARNLMNAQRLNLGFQPDHILNLSMDLEEVGFSETQGREFYRQAEERLSALPGVESVTQAFSVPMGYYSDADTLYVEGHPVEPGQRPPTILRNQVLPNYFETFRMSLVRGPGFTEADNEKAPMVAVVNQTMAKTFWPNDDPVGKRFSITSQTGPFIEVVGIVQDGKYRGPNENPMPFYYLSLTQKYDSFRTLHIRTSGPPEQLTSIALAALHEIAPNLPVFDVQTMTASLDGGNGFFLYRFGAGMTLAMGLLGLVLAIVGVYSVVSYAAAQRTHEIGIRMALGANRREILRMILRQGLTVVGIGVIVGLAAAFAATRVTAQLFAGVKPTDPLTYASVVTILTGVALLACWIPARRATRVDP